MVKNAALALWMAALPAVCSHRAATNEPFQGLVEFDERVLAFDVGGRVRELRVARGDRVHAGEVIAVLDDSLERPQRAARVADLEAARAQLALLRAGSRPEDVRAAAEQLRATRASEDVIARMAARQRAIIANGAAPTSTIDELDNQLAVLRGQLDVQTQRLALLRHGARPEEIAQASARVDAAAAAIDVLDTRLQHYTLYAPTDGVILDVPLKAGEVASPGTPVATLGDVDHPYIDVFVPQADIERARLGDRARIRIDATTRPLAGIVEHIADQTEFTPRFLFSERERSNLVVRVRVRVVDREHLLRAGVPAFVTFDGSAP